MHEGHRRRMYNKVCQKQFLYPHELLEVLLYSARPRKNLNEEAHRLIDKFGSINAVLSADVSELMQVKGIGINMANYLVCLGECMSRIGGDSYFAQFINTAQFREYLLLKPAEEQDLLEFYILDMDFRVKRICTETSPDGGRVHVTKLQIIRYLAVLRAHGVYVAYKRLSGDVMPTEEDDELVRSIAECCNLSATRFYDYCIISQGEEAFSYFVADRSIFGMR